MLCAHGCGNLATQFVKYNNTWICKTKASQCPVVKGKNAAGQLLAYKEGRKVSWRTSQGPWGNAIKTKGKTLLDHEDIFVKESTIAPDRIKTIIIREKLIPYQCSCGIIDSWNGSVITLELDHINGDNRNHSLSNLRFLCPNCHSQTDTFKGRNINKRNTKVTDEQILELINKGLNNRKLLIQLQLSPKGANYNRVNNLRNIAPVVQLAETPASSPV